MQNQYKHTLQLSLHSINCQIKTTIKITRCPMPTFATSYMSPQSSVSGCLVFHATLHSHIQFSVRNQVLGSQSIPSPLYLVAIIYLLSLLHAHAYLHCATQFLCSSVYQLSDTESHNQLPIEQKWCILKQTCWFARNLP